MGRGQQRRRGLPLPARSRSCTRRPSTPAPRCARCWPSSPTAVVAVEERGGRLPRQPALPRRRATGDMTVTDVEDLVAEPVSPGDHPRPRGHRRGLRRARRAAWASRAPTTSSAGRPGSTWPRPGSTRPPGLAYVCERARRRRRRRAGHRRRPQRHRDAARGPAAGWRWARRVQPVLDAADAVTGTVDEDGAAVELERWFRDVPPVSLPASSRTERLALPLWSRRRRGRMRAGRRRPGWHADFPRQRRPSTPPRCGTTATRGARARSCAARRCSARSASSARPSRRRRRRRDRGRLRPGRPGPRLGLRHRGAARPAGLHRRRGRAGPGQRAAGQPGQHPGAGRGAASPSCAAPTRRASW